MESWERAGEPDLSVDTDKYVKGFLYNDEPSLVATIRAESSMDERAEAKNALHEWSAGEGLALSFDFTFEELPA